MTDKDSARSVKISDSLTELYSALDSEVNKLLKTKFKPSCSKGCAGC